MSHPLEDTPALRADAAHYLTKHLAQALRRRVFQSEELAFQIAHEVVDDLARRVPGQVLRVPSVEVAPQADDYERAQRLVNRGALTFGQACAREGINERTGYRLVSRFRSA